MYTYKDVSYTDDQIKKAAEQSNMTVKEYLKKIKADKDPKPKTKDADLLDPTFQKDVAADAGVVSQPMTASQAGVTDLPSEDISSESPKTEEDLKSDNIDKVLLEKGTSIWSYSPSNVLNNLKEGFDASSEYKSVLTGKFSYDDFAQNQKINGVSIAELQAEDQNKAANSALNVIIKKYGDKSNDFVLNQGGNILKGADKELKTLYSSLKTVSDKDKQSVLDKIQEIKKLNHKSTVEPQLVDIDFLFNKFKHLEDNPIECFFQKEQMYFVDFNARLWPCCFVRNTEFGGKNTHWQQVQHNMFKVYNSLDWNRLDLYTVEEIINHPFYKKDLTQSFEAKYGLGKGKKLMKCAHSCCKKSQEARPIAKFKIATHNE